MPDDIKNEPLLRNFTNVEALAKTAVNQARLVGRDKVALPTQNSTQDELDQFYGKLGRPDSHDQYKFDYSEGFPEELANEDMEKSFREAAHKAGLSQGQFEKIMKWNEETSLQMTESQQQQQQSTFEQAQRELKQEFGNAYDDRIDLARRTAETFDLTDTLVEMQLDNDPRMIKALTKIGSSLSEDKIVGTPVSNGGLSPDDAKQEINQILGDSSHPYHNRNHPGHEQAVNKVNKLFQSANPR
jgi:hypothetical protein